MTEYSEPDAILVRHKALMETHREQMAKQKEVSETLEAVRQEYVAFVKVRSSARREGACVSGTPTDSLDAQQQYDANLTANNEIARALCRAVRAVLLPLTYSPPSRA